MSDTLKPAKHILKSLDKIQNHLAQLETIKEATKDFLESITHTTTATTIYLNDNSRLALQNLQELLPKERKNNVNN